MKLQNLLIVGCVLLTLAAAAAEFPEITFENKMEYGELVYGNHNYYITYKGPPHGYTFTSLKTRNVLTFYLLDIYLAADEENIFFVDSDTTSGHFKVVRVDDGIGYDMVKVVNIRITGTIPTQVKKIPMYISPENQITYYFFLIDGTILKGDAVVDDVKTQRIDSLQDVTNQIVDVQSNTLFYKSYYVPSGTHTQVSYANNQLVKQVILSSNNILSFVTTKNEVYYANTLISHLPKESIIDIQTNQDNMLGLLYSNKVVIVLVDSASNSVQQTSIDILKLDYNLCKRLSLVHKKFTPDDDYIIALNKDVINNVSAVQFNLSSVNSHISNLRRTQ